MLDVFAQGKLDSRRSARELHLLTGRAPAELDQPREVDALRVHVTATAGAVIYYGSGQLVPALAAAAVLGVQAGSWAGLRLGGRASTKSLKLLMAAVMIVVAALMLLRRNG